MASPPTSAQSSRGTPLARSVWQACASTCALPASECMPPPTPSDTNIFKRCSSFYYRQSPCLPAHRPNLNSWSHLQPFAIATPANLPTVICAEQLCIRAIHWLRLNLTSVKNIGQQLPVSAVQFHKNSALKQSSSMALHVPQINPEELKILLKCYTPTPRGIWGNLFSFSSALRALGFCNMHNTLLALRQFSAMVWGWGDARQVCVQWMTSLGRESLCQVWNYSSTVLQKILVPVQSYCALLQRVKRLKIIFI